MASEVESFIDFGGEFINQFKDLVLLVGDGAGGGAGLPRSKGAGRCLGPVTEEPPSIAMANPEWGSLGFWVYPARNEGQPSFLHSRVPCILTVRSCPSTSLRPFACSPTSPQ